MVKKIDNCNGEPLAGVQFYVTQSDGSIVGNGNGLYGTNDPTTQEQLATMLWRDAGSYVVDSVEETGASAYAVDAVRWLKAEKR